MAGNHVRVLGLACSPRVGGNTDHMLLSALGGAEEEGALVRRIHVPSLDLHPCRACNACFETGRCVQEDDMREMYPLLTTWEGIILAAPIFSMNLAAQAKILIDRVQCLYAIKYVLKKHTVEDGLRERRRGLWLSAAGLDRPDVFEPARKTVRYFFAMLEIKGWESVTYNPVEDKGEIGRVPGSLEACRKAGALVAGGREE